MKKFARNITLTELRALCRKKGWELDTHKHDHDGSDWVSFQWKRRNQTRAVIYSPWNGNFIINEGGKYITERSPDGAAPWLDSLLNLLYTNVPRVKEGA